MNEPEDSKEGGIAVLSNRTRRGTHVTTDYRILVRDYEDEVVEPDIRTRAGREPHLLDLVLQSKADCLQMPD